MYTIYSQCIANAALYAWVCQIADVAQNTCLFRTIAIDIPHMERDLTRARDVKSHEVTLSLM